MGIEELGSIATQYRLLYLQPDPEVGERICVALMFTDDLLYDPTFSKVKCFTREWRTDLLRLYLDEIRHTVVRTSGDFELALKRFAPLFSASRPRQMANPVTPESKLSLYQAYVANRDVSDAAARRRKLFVEQLSRFATAQELPPSTEVIPNATGREVLGPTRVPVRAVALALKGADRTVLLDGIDLNIDTAKFALRQASRITHTFWQYRLYGAERHKDIKRVALVFNGHSHERPELKDAHDFALQQFRVESDLVIDGAAHGANLQVHSYLTRQLTD